MSYRAITNLKSDFQNFQLNLNQISAKEISQNGGKSSSFSEMLSFYKEPIQKTADAAGETKNSYKNSAAERENIQNSLKQEKTEENSQKKSENEALNKVENSKNPAEENQKSQNISNEASEISASDVEKEKNEIFNKTDAKNLKKEKFSDAEDEKKSGQTKKNQKDDKKISARDFYRLNRLENDGAKNITEENAKNLIQKENADNFKAENQKKRAENGDNDDAAEIADYSGAENVSKIAAAEQNIQRKFKNSAEAAAEIETKIEIEAAGEIENPADAKKENKNEISDFKDLPKESQNAKNDFSLDKNGKIAVKDLRTFAEKTENRENPKKNDLKISDFEVSDDGQLTINMELNQNANADVLSLNNQTASANGSNFQAALNNQIQNNIPEFVKAGNIILKDNEQGQINLVLHPDDLGNVKIHLSLDGKTISGNIIVTSKEALQVFKDNAETLREAFIKNGFDAANFEVAYDNSGSSANQNFNSDAKNDETLFFAKKVYSNGDSVAAEENHDYAKILENYANYSVNIIA